ncbi:MAG: hypothetical protein KC467_12910 [Marinomonas atlantica]|nr:hypothetical protein [Marinomonas atlantica]
MLKRNLPFVVLPLLLTACATMSEPTSEAQITHQIASDTAAASPKTAEPKDLSLIDKMKQNQQQSKQKQSETEQETHSRQARFEHNLKQPKPVGTQVCTWQNSIGHVSAVEKDRIQINVHGRAMETTYGAFFGANPTNQNIEKQEATVWTDGEDWAVCGGK